MKEITEDTSEIVSSQVSYKKVWNFKFGALWQQVEEVKILSDGTWEAYIWIKNERVRLRSIWGEIFWQAN